MRMASMVLAAALALALPAGAFAQAAKAEGEVRKVDKEAQKVTIKHGPLKELDMPGMTMVFRVKDPAMLDELKVGEKINFTTEKLGGSFTVTSFEPAK